MIPIMAEAQFKLDPIVKTIRGVKQIYCGHCHKQLHYKTDEHCTLFSYYVYKCHECNREFNHAKRFPIKVDN